MIIKVNPLELIVKIRVKRIDGLFNIGTAFPVFNERLLTCRHIIRSETTTPPDISLQWANFDHSSEFKDHATHPNEDDYFKSKLIWENEELDLALVSTPNPIQINYINFKHNSLENNTNAITRGFPTGAKVGASREPISIRGCIHKPVRKDNLLQFDITSVSTAPKAEMWEGLSGAPIIVENLDSAVGVVHSVREALGGANYLEVMPAQKILCDRPYLDEWINASSDLIDLAQSSRILAHLDDGTKAKFLRERKGHKNWYMKEALKLEQAGLIDTEKNLTPLGKSAIKALKMKGGFKYTL